MEHEVDTHPKFVFTSCSLNQAELEPFLGELKRSRWHSFRDSGEILISLENLLKHPLRMYERDNVDMASSVIVRERAYY